MSGGRGDLDARLRRAFSGIDTATGFESRLAARIAALPQLPAAAQRARAERQRARAVKLLAREAWLNVATAVGVGAAVTAAIWRHGPAVARWTGDALIAAAEPTVLTSFASAVLVVGLWPVLKGLLPR
jgi:ferric-dicitrate binding protein FerR (iron transport regulator)